MSITKTLDRSVFLLKLYLKYTQKILKETEDPEIKLLILINYRDSDLKEILFDMYKISKKILESLKNNDLSSTYIYRDKLEKKYIEFKTKIKERIKNMVKIRAFYLAKTKRP